MSCIEVQNVDGVQIIRIARPEKKNALSAEMYDCMSEALVGGDGDATVKVHMFTGMAGVFSAGNDIGDFASGPEGARAALRFIEVLPQVDKPVVAAVDGLAVGIGTTLLFHCDLVFATPSAVFQTPFLDLGLVPEAASSLLAPQRMGYARAFELLALGNAFTAERALAAGIVNAIVAGEEVEQTTLAAARRLAEKPPEALRLARRLLRGDAGDIMIRIAEEAQLFKERLASPESREAFAAFLEKRKPDFSRSGE